MHNVVLTPIDPDKLISNISERVTANILQAVKNTTNNPHHKEQLLTVKGAAEFLNLTIATIYSKVSKGELPYMKGGKRLYFSNFELMTYLKEGRKKSNSEIEAEMDVYLSKSKK